MGVRFPYKPPEQPTVEYSDDLPPELKAQLDYASALDKMAMPEADPEAPSPGIGVGGFKVPGTALDYASPTLLHYLQQQGPAVRPGRGHDLANVLSVLGQIYTGSRVAGAEDRARKHAEDLALAREQRGELVQERRGAHQVAGQTLARYRWSKQAAADSSVPNTPELQAWAKANGVAIAPPDVMPRVPLSALNRDMPMQDPGTKLSPRALGAWSRFVAQTGTLPPLGMGSAAAGTRAQLLEGAVPFLEEGQTFAGNQAGFQANKASLRQVQVARDGAEAYRKMTTANSNRLLGLANEIKETGIPWANAPVRSWDKNVVGAVRMAKFHAALLPVQTEFARLLNAAPGSLAGVLTNEARAELQAVLGDNFTIPMLEGAIQTLQAEAGSRVGSYTRQVAEIQERMNPGAASRAAEQAQKKFGASIFSVLSGKMGPATKTAIDSLRTEARVNGVSDDSLSVEEERAMNRLPRKKK